MRSKNLGGGRARLTKLPPQPSAMAFSFLAQQPSHFEAHPDCSHNDIPVNESNNENVHSIVPETSSDSDDDGRRNDLAPNTSGKRVVLPEKLDGLGPQDISEPDNLEIDWTEKETCIKCDKSGKVLVCSDSGCPLSVHEKCMRCPARFDDMGNFYCPYCSYKRAILESRKARKKAMLAKKALSVFLDKGMINGNQQKQISERVKRKVPNPSTIAGDINHVETENKLDGNEVHNHSVQIEEDQPEERFDPEGTTSTLPSKGAEAPSVIERNDVVLSRCGDIPRLDNCNQHAIVVEQQIRPKSIIACGSGGVCCREEETGHQFEIVQVGKRVQAEHPREVDDHQLERVIEDEQQAEPLRASPVEEDPQLDGALHISTKAKRDNAEIIEKNEGRIAEEQMQEQAQETTGSSSGENPAQQVHEKDSDSFCGDTGAVSTRRRRVKKRRKNVVQVQAELPREVDDHQHERVVEDEQQAEPLRASLVDPTFEQEAKPLRTSPVEEDPKLDGALHISTKAKWYNAEILEANEGRIAEEQMQEQAQETTGSSSGENAAPQLHEKASDSSCGDTGTVSARWRCVKKRRKNVVQPQNVDPPRRSARKLSFKLNTTAEHNENVITTRKSRQFQEPVTRLKNPAFPNMKRKKLLWTDEEEEMLKEGVEKYKSTIKKNLPWRKILEFGQHVFDGTRTPVDLKDKWRNISVKNAQENNERLH